MTVDYNDKSGLKFAPGFMCFPVVAQLLRLGVDEERLRGKKVLDFGCGITGLLVRYLIENGVKAEGIDSYLREDLREKDFFMPRDVFSIGDIPRSDNYYDLITSHSNSMLRAGMTDGLDIFLRRYMGDSDSQRAILEGVSTAEEIMRELLRVMKKDGCMRCWPDLNRISEEFLRELENKGYTVVHQALPDIINSEREQAGKILGREVRESYEKRTLICGPEYEEKTQA